MATEDADVGSSRPRTNRPRSGAGSLPRHSRKARWFHAAVYLVTIPLIVTGFWLLGGGEGHPSPLARATGIADTELHIWLGRALAALGAVLLAAGFRAVVPFLRETLRHDRGDARWWTRLPGAILTGRFAQHEGDFDPGQRIANVTIVGGLLVLTVTGLILTGVHGGPVFAAMAKIHKWAAIVATAAIAAHVLVAAGVLPGYRGVWRSMHLGGRIRETTTRRLWPAWTERARTASTGRIMPVERDPGGTTDDDGDRSEGAPARRTGDG
jgi:cytochrome b subunit of formate dehydrogenase